MIKPELPSDDVQEIIDHLNDHQTYLVKDLIEHLGEKGLPFLILLLSLPFLQPIPLPGLSVVLGTLIASAGLGMMIKGKVWLPQFLANKSIETVLRPGLLQKVKSALMRVERLSYPPLDRMFYFPKAVAWFAGICIILEGLLLALPLPPGTNFPPALVLALLSLGYIQKNGLIFLAGGVIFAIEAFLILWLGNLIMR